MGTRSLLRQDVPIETASRNVEQEAKKMVRNNDRPETWRLTTKDVSRWDLLNVILFAAVCGACFAEPDTFSVFEDYFEIFGGGTRLAMPKTICAPDTSSLKAWFGGY